MNQKQLAHQNGASSVQSEVSERLSAVLDVAKVCFDADALLSPFDIDIPRCCQGKP